MPMTMNRKKRQVRQKPSTSEVHQQLRHRIDSTHSRSSRSIHPDALRSIYTEESSSSFSSFSAADSSSAPLQARKLFDRRGSKGKDELTSKYDVLPVILGTGRYGCVRKCRSKKTGKLFAVKSIKKSNLHHELLEQRRELQLLRTLDHARVMKAVDHFEDPDFLHIVTELYDGGELFDRLMKRGCFSEKKAMHIIKQVLEAVQYLHNHNVVHRDIKPENIMFTSRNDGKLGPRTSPEVKLIDFGLARKHKRSDKMMVRCVGTAFYVSPDVLKGRYDRSCDLWSVGVITYVLLCGNPPFNGDTNQEIRKSVLRDDLEFSGPHWDDVSAVAKDFIGCLMQRDPRKRYTANQALKHPWMKQYS